MRVESRTGGEANVVVADAATTPDEVVGALGLAPGAPVLAVFGGADGLAAGPEVGAIGAAIAQAAAAAGARIVEGGTDSGVMAVVGRAVAALPEDGVNPRPAVVGVAPAGRVTGPDATPVEPHQSHLVLAPADDWGGERDLLLGVSGALAGTAPVVAVVVGGGVGTAAEARAAVARGWPLVVVTGTGGLADRLAARSADLTDVLAGDVRTVAVADLDAALRGGLQRASLPGLRLAWQRFVRYDGGAQRLQRTFTRVQAAVLLLGVLGTALALVQHTVGAGNGEHRAAWDAGVHWLLVLAPAAVSVLIATATRFGAGRRWVLLREAAESVRREIVTYRARAAAYRGLGPDADAVLVDRLAAIDDRLLQTEVSSAPIPDRAAAAAVSAGDDDGTSPIDARGYLRLRVEDQLAFHRRKVARLGRRLRWFQVGALAAGGAGTVLAATGQELWIGLTTAVTSAAVAYLGQSQVETTLAASNHAIAGLEAARARYESASTSGGPSGDPDEAFHALVDQVEAVLEAERGVWFQAMNQALADAQLVRQARSVAALPTDPA